MQENTQLQVSQSRQVDAFSGADQFALAQRMARMLCQSSMVPDQYRGEANLGNCVIAMEMASRIGANVLSVMQNLYVVHGKPAWSSQFLISCVNASGRFQPLRYRMTGQKNTDTHGCIAWSVDKNGEELESPEVTIGMAKAEGWHGKNGSKWRTMPDLMLRYRAATLFARLYAPELTMGIRTDDEIIDVTPVVTEQQRSSKPQERTDGEPMVDLDPESAKTLNKVFDEAMAKPTEKPVGMTTHQEMFRQACDQNGVDFLRITKVLMPDKFDTVSDWDEIPSEKCKELLNSPKAMAVAFKQAKS